MDADIDSMIESLDPVDVVIGGITGRGLLDLSDFLALEGNGRPVTDVAVIIVRSSKFPLEQVHEGSLGSIVSDRWTGQFRVVKRLREPPDGRTTALEVIDA